MLMSFNPKTLSSVLLSIPRDTYVPIACNNNRYAKINSSAAYGTGCVISTINKFLDINIDYYVKINFKGVVDLVEAVGELKLMLKHQHIWPINIMVKFVNKTVIERGEIN